MYDTIEIFDEFVVVAADKEGNVYIRHNCDPLTMGQATVLTTQLFLQMVKTLPAKLKEEIFHILEGDLHENSN